MYSDGQPQVATTPRAVLPPIRSLKERVLQTLAYEAGGLLLVTPLYALVTGAHAFESVQLLVVIAVICMAWAAVHNTGFDWVEARLCGRVASDRPTRGRLLHAISHEASSIIVTTPAIMWLTGMGFWAALATDIGITMAYTGYAYGFHWVFDRLRPVRKVG